MASLADPSVSIVVDSAGTIYYSDLERVWMITRSGSKEIAVDDVHTHELWIGPDDLLYGEDVRNVGEAYRHRVWKRLPNGAVVDERPWRRGHPTDYHDYSFNRDAKGWSYILRRDNSTIEVRDSDTVIRTIDLPRSIKFAHWLTVLADGTVFVTAGSTLLRVSPDDLETNELATNLVVRTPEFEHVHDRHALMGVWVGPGNAVYVASYAGQSVRRITLEGTRRRCLAIRRWMVSLGWSIHGRWINVGSGVVRSK